MPEVCEFSFVPYIGYLALRFGNARKLGLAIPTPFPYRVPQIYGSQLRHPISGRRVEFTQPRAQSFAELWSLDWSLEL